MKEATERHINPQEKENQPTQTFTKTQHNSALKRSDTITQKIEEITHKMKSDQRSKTELQKKFDIQIKKIEVSKERLEADLAKTITELNKMELKVFDIQKVNLERFKSEIMRYEAIYNELMAKGDDIAEQLGQSNTINNLLYNQTFMLKEDYLAYSNELVRLMNKVEAKISQLKEIESQHPKEFKFMQEEFQLENTLKTITVKAKTNSELIKRNIRERESNSKQREGLLKQIVNVEAEMDNVLKETENIKEDNSSINRLEDSIRKAVSDVVLWEKMKEMMRLLCKVKENNNTNSNSNSLNSNQNGAEESNKRKLQIEKFMLKLKMDLIQMKKAKSNDQSSLETKLNEFNRLKASTPKKQQQKLNEDITETEDKLKQTKIELSSIEGNITVFETVFNKYIVLFKNEEKEDNDIETRFKTEMIRILISPPSSFMSSSSGPKSNSSESIKAFSQLLSDYFNNQITRDRKQIELQYSLKKTEDKKSSLNHDIDKLNEAIFSNDQSISSLQQENTQIAKDIITLTETISIKNKNLKSNLEALGEDQFNLYLESNETVLKNMKKIYGNKILGKVFKVQKDKFLEAVIVEHSSKKGIVNESIDFIVQYENIKQHYNTQRESLEANYQTLLQKYESCLDFQAKKTKEKSILDESKRDLKEKMEMILEEQLKSIQIEKQNLQLKYNVTFYIEQVKDISEQIERLTEAKRSILEEFEAFQKDMNQKGQQLFFETSDLKQSVATLNGMVIAREDSIRMNTKMTEERKSSHLVNNLEESVRKSLRDFHKKMETTNISSKNENNTNNNTNTEFITIEKININTKSNVSGGRSSNQTQGNYKQYSHTTPLELFTEKLKPLLSGLSLYKKFDSKSMSSRANVFDPFKADKYPPESCGYTLRYFKLFSDSKVIGIKKQNTSYHCETKLPLTSLVGIFLGQSSKDILKTQEHNSSNPRHQIELLCKSYFIPFTLVLENSKIDLIAPDYLTYTSFESAIKDIILNKHQIDALMEDLS